MSKATKQIHSESEYEQLQNELERTRNELHECREVEIALRKNFMKLQKNYKLLSKKYDELYATVSPEVKQKLQEEETILEKMHDEYEQKYKRYDDLVIRLQAESQRLAEANTAYQKKIDTTGQALLEMQLLAERICMYFDGIVEDIKDKEVIEPKKVMQSNN